MKTLASVAVIVALAGCQPAGGKPASADAQPAVASCCAQSADAGDRGLKKAALLCELPDACNTPDGMTLLPSGEVILSAPNFNDRKADPVLMRITKENKPEVFLKLPANPDSGRFGPMGISVAPSGDLYLADNQVFESKEAGKLLYGKSRLVRIAMKDGKPGDMVPVVTGMNVANAVAIRDGYIYVSETILVPDSKPLVSGVYRFKLGEEGVAMKSPLKDDPHLIGTIQTHNEKVPFGADGICFDGAGNLYLGNFADGTLHKFAFDGQKFTGSVFAKADVMKSCDGCIFNPADGKIYIADSLANAVQVVSLDGKVTTLAQDAENDGSGGRLDQPCEVLLRGKELIVANMDFPVPGGVNKTFDRPYTLSVIKLD